MDTKKLQELEIGSDVTVITLGSYQLVDVASGTKIPPLTEVTLPLNGFIMDHLVLGNLTLAGEDNAPKSENDALKAEDVKYTQDTQASRSKPTESAFGMSNAEYEQVRSNRAGELADGKTASRHGVSSKSDDAAKDEVSQGDRSGGEEGTSRAKRKNNTASEE